MIYRVTPDSAPALGDLRNAVHGDVILIRRDARERADYVKILLAAVTAVGRGATLSVEGYHPS